MARENRFQSVSGGRGGGLVGHKRIKITLVGVKEDWVGFCLNLECSAYDSSCYTISKLSVSFN